MTAMTEKSYTAEYSGDSFGLSTRDGVVIKGKFGADLTTEDVITAVHNEETRGYMDEATRKTILSVLEQTPKTREAGPRPA